MLSYWYRETGVNQIDSIIQEIMKDSNVSQDMFTLQMRTIAIGEMHHIVRRWKIMSLEEKGVRNEKQHQERERKAY